MSADRSQVSVGQKRALEFAATRWWERATPAGVARIQTIVAEGICPTDVFERCVSEAIGMPLTASQVALMYDAVWDRLFPEPGVADGIKRIIGGDLGIEGAMTGLEIANHKG